jgi:pimeloyl-ACP methyl ester carboxylesterase
MNIVQKTDRLLFFSKTFRLVRQPLNIRSTIVPTTYRLRVAPAVPLRTRTKRKKKRESLTSPTALSVALREQFTRTPEITILDILIANEKCESKSSDNLAPIDSLYVEEIGNGSEKVILLHGLARSLKYWEPMLQFMNKQKYSYLLPDLLGHGRSPSPSHLIYDVDTHLFFLFRDVVNKVNKPFHLIGHSLGSLLALELAARAPEKILSLTLISLPYFQSEEMMRKHFDILHPLGHPLLSNKFMCKVCCALICQNRNFWRPIIPFIIRNQVHSLFTSPSARVHIKTAQFFVCLRIIKIYSFSFRCFVFPSARTHHLGRNATRLSFSVQYL